MNTSIVPAHQIDNFTALVPIGATGHRKHRLEYYAFWLDRTGGTWIAPDLAVYRDYLLSADRILYKQTASGLQETKPGPLSNSSVASHLSTIRGRYDELLRDNRIREELYRQTHNLKTIADKKAAVDELLTRIRNGIDPQAAKVRIVKSQDVADEKHLRLTRAQAEALMRAPANQPGNSPLQMLRDTAIITLLLSTGIREAELVALDVADLRRHYGGELALHVRDGKGAKERMIPYGDLDAVLVIVDAWRAAAGISSGPVFRGFFRGGNNVRDSRLSVRAVNLILDQYPIAVNGQQTIVKPHDCRRTYARRMWEDGVQPEVIKQNLGHSNLETTLHYIGAFDGKQRRAPALYTMPDLSSLKPVL